MVKARISVWFVAMSIWAGIGGWLYNENGWGMWGWSFIALGGLLWYLVLNDLGKLQEPLNKRQEPTYKAPRHYRR